MSQSAQEYKNLLTEVVRKQIVILGPDITLAKIRKIKGISVDDTGTVTNINLEPQEITKQLTEQFRDLSEEIVKKTMRPIMLRDDSDLAEELNPHTREHEAAKQEKEAPEQNKAV